MVKLDWKKQADTKSSEYEEFPDTILKETEIYTEFSRLSNLTDIGDNWYNTLYFGDNLKVLNYLSKQFRDKITLIYIDPPFFSKSNYNLKVQLGVKNHIINSIAYEDRWQGGLDSYIDYMQKRLKIMKEILSENGSIYLHLDYRVSHYLKLVMDEIFGENNFRNEIIWAYPAASAKTRRFFIRSYDSILFYTKSDNYIFNDTPEIYMEYSDRVKNALKRDEKGLFYYRGGSHDGKKLSRKVYIKNNKGIFPRDVWHDIPYIRANTLEYQGFSTQKPERLLRRIILASSNQDDIVADFFCGSGTTIAAAEKLNRRWIGCDSAYQSIHMTRKRMLNINKSRELINWKSKYAFPLKPFKIAKAKEFKSSHKRIRAFLSPELQTKMDSEKLELKPSFEIVTNKKNNTISVQLKAYINPYNKYLREDIQENVNSLNDWIDYWSIDFQYDNSCFKNMWSSFKTPRKKKISTKSPPYVYKNKGSYSIGVKVIDFLGLETIQILKTII